MRVGVPGNRPLGHPRILLFRHVGSRATRCQALQPLLDVWARHPLHSKRPLRYNPTITEPPTGSTTARTMARSNPGYAPAARLEQRQSHGTRRTHATRVQRAARNCPAASEPRQPEPDPTTDRTHQRSVSAFDRTNPADRMGRTHPLFRDCFPAMRNILVDYCRVRHAAKRGGAAIAVTLTETVALSSGRLPDVLELDEALNCLAKRDERKAKSSSCAISGVDARRDRRCPKSDDSYSEKRPASGRSLVALSFGRRRVGIPWEPIDGTASNSCFTKPRTSRLPTGLPF